MKRKLGEDIPERLEIVKGKVRMVDGTNAGEYLEEWQGENHIQDGTKICIVTKESIESLEKRLRFLLDISFV